MADSHPSSCTSWCDRETHVDQHPEQVRAGPPISAPVRVPAITVSKMYYRQSRTHHSRTRWPFTNSPWHPADAGPALGTGGLE